jgi:hypothetical protein
MKLDALDLKVLKEMAVALNEATYKDGDADAHFVTGKGLKTVAVSKEGLAAAFDDAIRAIPDDVVNDLPGEIIDFYNEYFSEAEPGEVETAATTTTAAETKATPAKEKKEKKEKSAKEKKEKVPRAKKEKTERQLSCFGHVVGTQSAAIDEMLLPGKPVTLEALVEGSGRSKLGVKGHIKHLIDSRGLIIENKDGVYRYIKE